MDAEQTFIEVQFPVSRLSKESYKERKANYSQTLTSRGFRRWRTSVPMQGDHPFRRHADQFSARPRNR